MGADSRSAVGQRTDGADCETVPVPCHVVGLAGGLSMGAGAHSLRRGEWIRCLGGGVAALGYVHTGMLAAVPAATGLTALAASDITTHRFSLRTLRLASIIVCGALIVDSARFGSWNRLLTAGAVTALVCAALAGTWLVTRGIAFGDVLLTTFAVAVPAWLSPGAAAVTVVASVLAAFVTVLVRRIRRSDGPSGVALGPALVAGWIVAMVVG